MTKGVCTGVNASNAQLCRVPFEHCLPMLAAASCFVRAEGQCLMEAVT